MAQLTIPHTFTTGDTISAIENNENNTAIKTFCETLSAGGNFDAGAVNTEDIASSAITEAKIASSAVTSSKIAASITLTTPNIGVATGSSLTTQNAVIDHTQTNARTNNYTLVIGDDGIIIETNSTSGIVITVPTNASVPFIVGTRITILRANTGAAIVAGDTGVTVNATPGLNLRAQWSAATLLKRATNTWVLMGDLSS
jgi:hypothetical protein